MPFFPEETGAAPESPASFPYDLIDRYYPAEKNAPLRHVLLTHSSLVCRKALTLARRHPELGLDLTFVHHAALLHDVGIFLCDAPAIYCYGREPYLRHGLLGAELMRKEGLPRYARVCERHTGAGLTKEEIEEQHLPLPPRDFLPETLEEKLICYADKFYSKTHLETEKTPAQALCSIARFGADGAARFEAWQKLFE